MAIFTEQDYRNLVKIVRVANQRIQRLQSKYGDNSWALNELYSRIDNNMIKGVSISGNIKVNRNMSDIELKAIAKATEGFLKSKTSTLRGVSKTIKNVKKSLQATFGDEANKISDNEIDKLYGLVEDKETRGLVEEIGASTLWAKTIRAKEQDLSFNEYTNLFSGDIDINDKDIREFLEETYNKYKL